nr:N-acetylneuraminate synthase family protein [Sphaerisporangium rubeum]
MAVVPARGGSVGVPLKNLAKVGGLPLVTRAVNACVAAGLVDEVVVSTDHAGIAEAAAAAGARIVDRPAGLSGATASSESAVLHALHQLAGTGEPEVVVLVQCTSAFIDPADLDAAVAKVLAGEADVVFSAVETHEFVWNQAGAGVGGVNHDPAHRPRRQDRAPEYRETGAFYVMRAAGLREHGHRFFGAVAVQTVPAGHAVEVDTPGDLEIVRALAPVVDRPGPIDVDAVITDFDGVHTDDHVYVDQEGREAVAVSRSDGLGFDLLKRAGVKVLVLSTERNPVVTARARKLGVPVLQGLSAKHTALRDWLSIEGLDPARVAYVGNDVNDLGCLDLVGWPVATPGAHPRVLAAARVVLTRAGGDGAVRELCDRVLAARPGGPAPTAPAVRAAVPAPRTPRVQAAPVGIGGSLVGPGQPVYVIGEIGINHNGDLDIARRLIDVAADAGCQAVKFQKRTPEICVPVEQRDLIRQTPWGEMTYLEYKHRVEFGAAEYAEIGRYCAERGIDWFASPWDVPSVDFLEDMDVVAHKVASASVTDLELLRRLADTGKPLILSTGMSTLEEIDTAVEILGTSKLVMMHATSTYPLPPEEANLRAIVTLRERYGVPVGYSGHERGLQISLAAVTLGAVTVERHITLDRTMWGSDHAASLEPSGLEHLVRDIRIIETALGDGVKRVFPGEEAPKSRLRRVTV